MKYHKKFKQANEYELCAVQGDPSKNKILPIIFLNDYKYFSVPSCVPWNTGYQNRLFTLSIS